MSLAQPVLEEEYGQEHGQEQEQQDEETAAKVVVNVEAAQAEQRQWQ